jgi:hypothetical protein
MAADDLDQRAPSLFTPDSLLATQYFERIRRRRDLTGEQRLMYAVVEFAVDDYVKYAAAGTDRRRRELFLDAERWVESDDRSWPFAFESICDHLGLDADYLRRGFRELKRRDRGDARASAPTVAEPPSPERRRASNE